MFTFKNYFIGGGNTKQWTVLKHNGPLFPPEYIPHKIPIIVKNNNIILPPLAEEYATMFAKYIDTKYYEMNNFKKNFWKDFKPTLRDIKIDSLDEIDFSLIKKHLEKEKEKKSLLSKEDKNIIKNRQQIEEEPYMHCIIDGNQQKVGNYKIEPPGIFLGRGSHPKIGKIKTRIYPEDVILNLDKESPIPKLFNNHKWGKIIHDNTVIWLATWKDNITGKNKYIFTSFESFFKSKSDEDKFDLAKKLKRKINSIRETYEKELDSNNNKNKQLATALYLIDNLALRVGNEKGEDEADTVGVCSLRVEHVELLDDNFIGLDFLGKDSIRYQNKVKVHEYIYTVLSSLIKGKKKDDDIFDEINTNLLNKYLKDMMKNLTAKVFRTYNASFVFQNEINIINDKFDNFKDKEDQLNILLDMYNRANLKVATLCNHQKNVSKSFNESIENFNSKIKELNEQKKELSKKKSSKEKLSKLNSKIKLIKGKKDLKIELKNVSLTTSKTNYIDPRITIAFLKRHNIPMEKIFSQTLIDKFFWAVDVDKNWKF